MITSCAELRRGHLFKRFSFVRQNMFLDLLYQGLMRFASKCRVWREGSDIIQVPHKEGNGMSPLTSVCKALWIKSLKMVGITDKPCTAILASNNPNWELRVSNFCAFGSGLRLKKAEARSMLEKREGWY